jgi:hypothetical protein
MSGAVNVFSLLLAATVSGALGQTAHSEGALSAPEMAPVTEEPASRKRKRGRDGNPQFVCLGCSRGFTNAHGLTNHLRAYPGHCPQAPEQRTVTKRTAYTYAEKFDVVTQLIAAEAAGEYKATSRIANAKGIKEKTVRQWKFLQKDIIAVAGTRHKNKKKLRWFTGLDEQAEQQVYFEFCQKRDLGRKVRGKWLRKTYKKRVKAGGGKTKGSKGWLAGFLRRWSISSQCRTNKKTTPIMDRKEKIMAFHTSLIYGLQWTGTQRCPKYGRFPAETMFHMDQVPIEFTGTSRKTYNRIGDRSGCRLGDPSASDAGKRFCTVQMTIRAGGPQIVPCELIFRRKDSVGLSGAEMAHYANLPNIRVRFQGKAWADEGVMLDYFHDFRRDTADLGEVMLGMDNHGSQQTNLCRTLMEYLYIVPVYTPANCTDVVSPCDHHVGRDLQVKLVEQYEV